MTPRLETRARAGSEREIPSGVVVGYAAALLAFASAGFTLYWTLGGRALLSTVGAQFVDLAERGGPVVVAGGLLVVALKMVGGMLALALVRPWGAALPLRLMTLAAVGGGGLLAAYGGLLVVVGAMVLGGAIDPSTPPDRVALRWHVFFWDLWFLLWGLLLVVAGLQHRRRRAYEPTTRNVRLN